MALKELTGLDWQIAFTAVSVLLLVAAETICISNKSGETFLWMAQRPQD
jgi:hypothetical protein